MTESRLDFGARAALLAVGIIFALSGLGVLLRRKTAVKFALIMLGLSLAVFTYQHFAYDFEYVIGFAQYIPTVVYFQARFGEMD
jgi:hypothetical protein